MDTGPSPDMLFDRDTTNCSIARTLEVVGEKWTLLILREVWYGASRFSDLNASWDAPATCSPNGSTSRRPRHPVHEPYQEAGARRRLRYVITPKGTTSHRRCWDAPVG